MLSSFIKQSNNWLSVKGLISSPSAATTLFSRSFSSNDCCGNNNEKCIVKPELVDVHKKGMFCFQCQETNKNTGCTIKGMCGKDAYTANLQDKLIQICKEISTACANLNDIPREVGPFLTQSLFITITNANFDSKRIKFQIRDAIKLRNSLLEKIPSKTKEDIKAPFGVKSNSNADIVSLRELITYGLKGLAAYTEHAYNLDQEDPEIYKFMVKCLAGLANDKLSIDDLVKLTLECGDCAVKAMKLLDHANTSTYGNPTVTTVNIGVGTRPGILVSGHDLRDIKDLLEQTKDQGIDIYTHGEMLPSHYYPELKKYKHLYGNYGGSWFMQDVEFGPFNGPILMTTNCIVPVKKEYKDRIFTTGVVGYEGLKHIPDRQKNGQKDFSEIIQLAKTIGKPPTQLETGHIVGGFAHNQVFALADKVVDAVKSGAIKKFVIMGGCDGRHKNRDYFTKVAEALPKDTVILTAGCAKYRYIKLPLGDINGIPRVLDAGQCNDSYSLAVIALKLKEVFGLDDVNKLPIAFDIAWYEQKAVAVLLALLALGFKNIRIGPTLPGFLSPNVANVLVNNFGISCSTTVAEDIPKLIS